MNEAHRLLACVYTCEAHRHLLARFYDSAFGRLLRESPGTRIVEVYADPALPASRMEGDLMLLKTEESYLGLVSKTQRMIEFAVREFRFDNLLKIDVTTILTAEELAAPEYAQKKALDPEAVAGFLRDADYSQDYIGVIHHVGAGRAGAESWAGKKGIPIDYPALFGDEPMPPYFTGKVYVLSRRLAEFIARNGAEMAAEQERHFPGSEDVFIGRMHELFQAEVSA